MFFSIDIASFAHSSSLLISTNDHAQNRHQNKKFFLQAWHFRSKYLLNITSDGVSRSNVSWLDNHNIRPIVVGDPRAYKQWYKYHLHGMWEDLDGILKQDPLFHEMQAKCVSPKTMESRIAFPIELYMNETPFRIQFFEKMKSLARLKFETFAQFDQYMTVTFNQNTSQNVTVNLVDFAWSLIVAIKTIRTCNISYTLTNKLDGSSKLCNSISNVPLQHFHGAAFTDDKYFSSAPNDDHVVFKENNNTLQKSVDYDSENVSSFAQLLVENIQVDPFVPSEYRDSFEFVFRAIWIHSKVMDISLLQHTTNFNSWSTQLEGAVSVALHFLEYDTLPIRSYNKLIILAAKTKWNFVQSIRKWYSDIYTARNELEVVTPPFMKYIINTDAIQLPMFTFRHYFTSLQQLYVEILNKTLLDENILMFQTEMIEFTWDTWFAHMN